MDTPEQPIATQEKIKQELVQKWNYETFKNYLLLLGNNKEALLPYEQYPTEIELSSDWHELLNRMRVRTHHHQLEEWAGIAFRADQQSLFLPEFPSQGEHEYVPGELIMAKLEELRKKYGFTGIIGDIHSHPRKLERSFWRKIVNPNSVGSPSIADIYCLVSKGSRLKLMGIIDGEENILMFRSQESKSQDIGNEILSQEGFEKFWYESYGYKYLGDIRKNGANRTVTISSFAEHPWKIAQRAAFKHKVVLYKGAQGKNFRKINF